MNLGVSIANLLRRYPAVDVPGIGVFKRTHDPASYDAEQSVFLPPADRIELVEGHSDVFPITAYMQAQQQVDRPTAMAMLETAVKEVVESISKNGEALLEGLGYLASDGQSVMFRPFEADKFAAKPIAAPSSVVGETDEAEVAEEDIELADAELEGRLTGEEHPNERSYTRWVVTAAVTVLLIAVGVTWYYQPTWFGGKSLAGIFEPKKVADYPTPSNEMTPLVVVEQDSAITDSGELAAAVIDSTSVGIDSVQETDALPVKPSITYEIIVGSFATMRQANKFVAEMKAKGYNLHAIDSRMPGNRKKISWGSFASEEEAYKELARVQKTFEPGAWIAKVEHNQD